MQKELLELYKKYKVNPVSGCLPMIVQIPVFFALYTILSIAIEPGALLSWAGSVDLSSKDPYYVLPIIMGVTMVIQQKMTPSTMDPVQQKIMLVMPIVFTFLFISFPSGLVLYWLINNILGIGQQYYINKKIAEGISRSIILTAAPPEATTALDRACISPMTPWQRSRLPRAKEA
ncbi:MAG: membrane protein insertase YidC [Desulfobacterales bacterium]|nr:membrane protein insertase YidC [Desulfobacterales bacterium]